MNTLNSILFYIFTFICLLGALFSLLSKKTIYCVLGAVIAFWSLSGLYFLLGLHFLAVVQILVYGVAIAILLAFSTMLTRDAQDLKILTRFSLKAPMTVALLAILALLIFPFLKTALQGRDVFFQFALKDFAQELYTRAFLPFELVSILLLVGFVGIAALLYRRRR